MLLLLALPSWAVPTQLTHTGRLLDGTGVPLTNQHTLTFTLYDGGGSQVWTADEVVDTDNGYYTAILDVDTTVFDGTTLELGIAIDGGTELPDRQSVVSVPYAYAAGTARNVEGGGIVDASEIRIGGNTVIDGTGIVSGDNDTLGDLACSVDQLPVFDGSAWICSTPSPVDWTDLTGVSATLTDGEVGWTELTGVSATLADGDVDWAELTGVSATLSDGEVDWAELTGVSTTLSDGEVDWAELTGVSAALADGAVDWAELTGVSATLSDGQVDWAEVTGIPGELLDGDDDNDTLATLSCGPDQVAAFSGGAWSCADDQMRSDTEIVNVVEASPSLTLTGDLTVGGSVQVADNTATCDDGLAGSLRWNGTLEVCTGASAGWVSVKLGGAGTQQNPGLNCLDILNTNGPSASGPYWIDPDGGSISNAFIAYCDMTTDGGGWTQVEYMQSGDAEGFHQDYASVVSSVVRGTAQSGSYKIDASVLVQTADELRYSEPSSALSDSYVDTWAHDFSCDLDSNARSKLTSPGNQNQVPAGVTCRNINTSTVSSNAILMNYQQWSGCWTGPRLWIGSSASAGQYHGDYCVDCVVTWKCNNGTDAGYSGPSDGGTGTGYSLAFWLR